MSWLSMTFLTVGLENVQSLNQQKLNSSTDVGVTSTPGPPEI